MFPEPPGSAQSKDHSSSCSAGTVQGSLAGRWGGSCDSIDMARTRKGSNKLRPMGQGVPGQL